MKWGKSLLLTPSGADSSSQSQNIFVFMNLPTPQWSSGSLAKQNRETSLFLKENSVNVSKKRLIKKVLRFHSRNELFTTRKSTQRKTDLRVEVCFYAPLIILKG